MLAADLPLPYTHVRQLVHLDALAVPGIEEQGLEQPGIERLRLPRIADVKRQVDIDRFAGRIADRDRGRGIADGADADRLEYGIARDAVGSDLILLHPDPQLHVLG